MESQEDLDDLLDRLVASYSDRVNRGGDADPADVLARAPAAQRPALERCLRMIRAGLSSGPRVAEPLGPGAVVDGYRIVRELGRGGMAVVYLAEQPELRRPVALKVLRPGLAVESVHVDRFRREALAIARLKHPHIVQVYGVGEGLGYHYIAMEYVDGPSLDEVLGRLPRGRPWTARDLAEATGVAALGSSPTYEQALAQLLVPVARAIAVAHELGLLHRDVKPSNILLHADGRAVIADFGLAKQEGSPALSLSGEAIGTPYYMSPEQAEIVRRPIDQRTDVYSLGVTLYEALTGRRPFEGETLVAVLEAIRTRVPPSPRSLARGLSRDAELVVLRAMERDPDDRYPTALELAADLGALAEGRPTQALARLGSWRQRLARSLRTFGTQREVRSAHTFLGLPLYHFVLGPRHPGERLRVAKGWLAVGDVALGGLACGGISCGLLGFGGISLGGFVFAGIALGVAPIGGIAIGALAYGGIAIGYGAFGGMALGHYACGGSPHGTFRLGGGGHRDQEVITFMTAWMPWALWLWTRDR